MLPVSSVKVMIGSITLMSGMKEHLRMHFKHDISGNGFSSWDAMLNGVGIIFRSHQGSDPE